jgi:NAD(P)-dependent dehydrogenase (short-subunit alcohol dehydrogenase family)
MHFGLKDRVYIVTGGPAIWALAAASELVADGARVVVSGRSEKSVAVSAAQRGVPSGCPCWASRERRARWAASTRPYQSGVPRPEATTGGAARRGSKGFAVCGTAAPPS